MTLDQRARTRLRMRYIDSLPRKIEQLERLISACHRGEEGAHEKARSAAHQLVGSGASYGFPRITELARAAEHAGEENVFSSLFTLMSHLGKVYQEESSTLKGTILIVEDDEDLQRLAEAEAGPAASEVIVANDAASARRALAENRVSVVLLDLILPDDDGRAVLRWMREQPTTAHTPVVVLSAVNDERTRRECMELGVDHYLIKPLDISLLSTAIAAAMKRGQTFHQEARQDSLTGLRNRAGFRESVQQLQSLAARTDMPISLGIIDLDFFKSVNDQYGHAMGDQVLVGFAKLLQRRLRLSDVTGRWGGEEFVVAFPDTGIDGAALAMRSVQDTLRRHVFTDAGESLEGVTFSAGVTELTAKGDLDDALEGADRLLYRAKSLGRDRVLTPAEVEDSDAGLRVLVAEDDPDAARILQAVLESDDYTVTVSPDGLSALRAAEQVQFGAVILDWNMPGLTGDQLLAKLRAMKQYGSIPIMVLTALGAEANIARAFDLGADDYVQKPFRQREVLARLRRLLKR